MDDIYHAIWNPDVCAEGVFCPKCNCFMDDYYGQPDKCPRCGINLRDGWIDARDNKKKEV